MSEKEGKFRRVVRKKVVRKKSEYTQPELPFDEPTTTATTQAVSTVRKKKVRQGRKVKKRVRARIEPAVTHSPGDASREAAISSDDEAVSDGLQKAIKSLAMKGRAYKLSFGSLSTRRTLTDRERASTLKQDDDALSVHKNMYADDDPFVKALRMEVTRVRDFFNLLTKAHPEKATRLFVAVDPKDKQWEDMTDEEAEEEMARQLNAFHDEMHARIEKYRTGAVQDFIDNYDDILERAKDYLSHNESSLFDPTQYVAKNELANCLFVEFRPVPSVLPPEYSRIDPQMQVLVASYIREQLESSLAIQLTNVESALTESLQGLTERIEGINNKDKQRFYASRVDNVVSAIGEYERTMEAFGLDLGSSLGTNLTKLRASLQQAGNDSHKVIGTLKESDEMRAAVLSNLKESIGGVGAAFKPIRRRITMD